MISAVIFIILIIIFFWKFKPKRRLYVHNPLMKYPRNETCYCNSGKKYKRCHALNEEPFIIVKSDLDVQRIEQMKELIEKIKES